MADAEPSLTDEASNSKMDAYSTPLVPPPSTSPSKPDPPSRDSLHDLKDPHLTSELSSSASATKSPEEEEEDEMVAQARAIALSAAKLSQQKKPKGLNLLNIAAGTDSFKDELPLGDLQQRKLIEAKLGQKLKHGAHPQAPDPPVNHNPLKAVAGLADVKDKIDGFIKEQQQKIEESWTQRDAHFKTIIGGTVESASPASSSRSASARGLLPIPILDDKDSVAVPSGQDEGPVLLSAVVYKRRSGYGKYSASRAWERRRMDLKGSTIRYFKTIQADKNGKSTSERQEVAVSDDELGASRPTSPVDAGSEAAATNAANKKKDIRELWEQAKENITKTTENINKSLAIHQTLDPNAPRGSIDLIKENATIAALSSTETYSSMSNYMGSYSASPTPFGICIIVKNEIKWKICFDTQKEQMQWLVALTDIVIRNNVDCYNEELTKSRRGVSTSALQSASSGDDTAGAVVDNEEDGFRSPPGGSDNELWKVDNRYSVNSVLNGAESGSNEISDTSDRNTNAVQGESQADHTSRGLNVVDISGTLPAKTPLSLFFGMIKKGAASGPSISLKGNNLYAAASVANIGIYIAYMIESKWAFRFLLLFMNFMFWLPVTGTSDSDLDGDQSRSILLDSIENYIYKNQKGKTSSAQEDDKPIKRKRDLAPPEVKEGFKPIAGSSTAHVENSTGHVEINGNKFVTWDVLPLDDVLVRSHGYLTTKEKVPSPPSLYEIVGCDFLSSGMRLTDIASKVQLPKMDFDDEDSLRTWKSPDLFVVSLAVPTEEPSFSRPTTDGLGFSLTVYYKMKKETRKVLRKITAPDYNPSEDTADNEMDIQQNVLNAIKLWENWCATAENDEKMQARFKFIPNVHNPKEIGLPSYIAKYCGKPVLIKRANVTGFLSSNPDLNAMEFGISLHPFPYLAKKAMAYLKTNIFPKAIVSLSYVIEGRSNDELPEVLIGDAVSLKYPDIEFGCECNDFLAGTSKTSKS